MVCYVIRDDRRASCFARPGRSWFFPRGGSVVVDRDSDCDCAILLPPSGPSSKHTYQLMKPSSMLGAAALTMLLAACGASKNGDPNATSSAQLVLNEIPD